MPAERFAVKDIKHVAVIGSGTMGAQIATLAASHGYPVRLYDAAPEALRRAQERIQSDILPAIDSEPTRATATTSRLTFAASLEAAVVGADLVIEAVKEDLDVKRAVFADLSRLAPTAILATNSSSIPSAQISAAVASPERLLNMHFFAPIWVRSMLELMSSGTTSDEVMARTRAFGRSLGLMTAIVNGQSKGFIINRIWRAVKRESLRVVDEGVASAEDIDRLWMLFFGTKYAPFGIMDMVGLDVVRDIEWSYQRETRDPTDIPSTTLLRMIEAGALGEKSGQGFYTHPNPAYLQTSFLLGDEKA
jgi:3-hydroxybutyryl-CoA dehydrogenase